MNLTEPVKRSRSARTLLVALVLTGATSGGWSGAVAGKDLPPVSVGVLGRIDQLVLPGTPLEVKAIDDRKQPIVLRIAASFPHGTDYRYDLAYYGLEPGEYDLKDYLQRQDGSPMDDLPSLLVQVDTTLPPGQMEPNKLDTSPLPRVGGYRILLIVSGIVWAVGLIAILSGKRRHKAKGGPEGRRSMTLAERLRVTVENAVEGKVDQSELAELERMLIGYWRKKLDLNETDAVHAIAHLRDHEEAGSLLKQLEQWLHNPAARADVDVARLLEPYRDVPAEELHDLE